MDGWVTIGTKLDTTKLEKDLKDAKRRLANFEKEAEDLGIEKIIVEDQLGEYEKIKQEIQESTDETLKKAQTEEQVTNVLQMEEKQLEKLKEQYKDQFDKLDNINSKLKENAYNQSLVKNEIEQTNTKLGQSEFYDDAQSGLKKIGGEIKKNISKVIRWGLALLGIRTILSLLTRSFSTLMQYNDELKDKLESMKLMLAVAFEPIINWLVNMAEYLVSILATLMNTLFGIDIYARAMELYAKNTNKNLGGASKSARDLRKQLAGFDEMNVLNDNVTASGGGGSSFNFTPLPQGEIPKWLQWIIDHKDEILAVLGGIGTALLLIKLGVEFISALGIGAIVGGVIYAVKKLLKYLKDPSWKNFGGIIQGIGVALLGLGVVTGNVGLIIAGVITTIVGTFFRYWESIKGAIEKGLNWLEGKSKWIHEHLGGIIGSIYDTLIADIRFIWNYFKETTEAIKLKFDGIIEFIRGIFHKDWHEAFEGLFKIAKADLTPIFSFVKNKFEQMKTIGKTWATTFVNATAGSIKIAVNAVFGAVERFVNDFISLLNGAIKIANKLSPIKIPYASKISIPRLAKGGIVNLAGKGVPVGNAIAGERGAEGVIPLTDSQQMALLGEAIGRYITINANITNTMNGRVISKELHKIQNDVDFAYNR